MTDVDDVLDGLAAQPDRAALLCDFDGTLAPIVEDPTTSRLLDGLDEVLPALAGRLRIVAVVSGRPAAFLGERAALPGVRCLGLYGMEELRDGAVVARPDAARWQDVVARAREDLQGLLGPEEGVLVEDKGLAVAVHWRNAPDRGAAAQAVTAAVDRIAEETGLGREPGKLVDELRPPVDWDKGRVVRGIAAELGDGPRLAYLGDDLGDLAAFAAAREVGGWAVAVDHGEETPEAVRAAGDVVLDGPAGVAGFLRALRDRVG